MPGSHPRTGRTISTVANSRYEYNSSCNCEICANDGQIPEEHAEVGHAFAYGLPHVPPVSRPPWRQ
jgi:hypothetical protein